MLQLRDYQRRLIEGTHAAMRAGHRRIMAVLPTGCHAVGEEVLMADGRIEKVENVKIGDRLMGSDGTPRTVLHRQHGTRSLYRVTPVKGEPFIVTGNHRLTLSQIADIRKDQKPDRYGRHLKDVTVEEWLNWPKSRKHVHKLVRSSAIATFGNKKPLPLDPYTYGALLGDGGLTLAIKITNSDPEVIESVRQGVAGFGAWLERNSFDRSETYDIKTGELGVKGSRLHRVLVDLGARYKGAGDKSIHFDYLTSDIDDRLQVLAGLIDTDGSLTHAGYDFVSKSSELASGVAFIARSVGLAAYVSECKKSCQGGFSGTYYRVYISGDCSSIPCRVARKKAPVRQQAKNVLHTGFKVDRLPDGEYVGFIVDGDNRYLLGDFTITHNSGKTAIFAWMAHATAKRGKVVWFLVHRRELLHQTQATFERFAIPTDGIHIGMVGQVARNSTRFPKPDLIVFDEAHHSPAATWQKIIARYPDAWMIGLTATPCRLDGKPLGAIYQTLVEGLQTAELIRSGWLSPYRAYSVDVADLSRLRRRGADYDMGDAASVLMERAVYGDVIRHYRAKADGLQAIVFCTTVEHARTTAYEMGLEGIRASSIDGTMRKAERDDMIARFRSGEITVLTSCELISEGFDLPAVSAAILLRPTQSLTVYLQQVGRALRPADGKTAIILDHVGNINRHGLPDTHRAWSLTEQVAPHRQHDDSGALTVRTCKACYAVYEPHLSECPYCGAPYEPTREEIKQIREVELKEITREQQTQERLYLLSDQAIEDAESYSDLCKIAKVRGYKVGWAWHRAKAAGLWTPY